MSVERIKQVQVVEYFNHCNICDGEFAVSKDSTESICYACKIRRAIESAERGLKFLIGAEIIEITPFDWGHLANENELGSVIVKTKDGRLVTFTAGGWDNRYIEWEENKEGGDE